MTSGSRQKTVRVGIIGGGLMGRETASAFARWCALVDMPVRPELVAVADVNPAVLDWFANHVPSATLNTSDYREILDSKKVEVDVVYAAVPHHLHQQVYLDVLEAGKDLLAEKPFGIDVDAAREIAAATGKRFVRCSSEFPFLPGAQRLVECCRSGSMGRILDIVAGLHHASDLDPDKPSNWKRQSETCGEIGVMGDLGLHVLHIPLRLGWKPERVYAQLQKGYPERRGVSCDTWDNALLHTWMRHDDYEVPMRFEMKRLAPGQTNSWFLEVRGTEGGIRYSTAEPKSVWTFRREGDEQSWARADLGFEVPFQTITGGVFEVGFPDLFQQMWAAYFLEREGSLGERFGCMRPEEAVMGHSVFQAALESQKNQMAVTIP